MDQDRVTDIKYKQMDKDPELKNGTEAIERMFLGEKGVGLFSALGITPGKVQLHLDRMEHNENEGYELLNDADSAYIMNYLRQTLGMKGATDADKIEMIRQFVEGYFQSLKKSGSEKDQNEGSE